MYKKLLLYISILFIYILIGCSTNKTDLNPTEKLINLEKITVSETVYSIEDFEKFGFKVSKSYKIKNLPSANGAWYGFWIPPEENSNGEFVAFEIRSYPSHELAVKDGKFFADEVSGPKGKLKSSEVSWKEGTADRRKSGFNYGGGGAKLRPKYGSYIIYSNLVILCEGVDEEISMIKCKSLINKLINIE